MGNDSYSSCSPLQNAGSSRPSGSTAANLREQQLRDDSEAPNHQGASTQYEKVVLHAMPQFAGFQAKPTWTL